MREKERRVYKHRVRERMKQVEGLVCTRDTREPSPTRTTERYDIVGQHRSQL